VDFSEPSSTPDKAALAPWRSPLAHALHRNRSLPNSRYAQLATVRPDGFPANRTLVVRGFLPGGNQLRFVTDGRSEKVGQGDRAELCWYFPKTREQFRIRGRLRLVDAQCADEGLLKARRVMWHELSDGARLSFLWPEPGRERAGAEAFVIDPPDNRVPARDFCLLLMEPIYVDHLELRGEPQNRCIYRLENGEWEMSSVNP
jgi:pyridoxamine 5'-phosphate oxidase